MVKKAPDPTEEEIETMKAEIQGGWTEKMKRKRSVVKPKKWSIPEISTGSLPPGTKMLIESINKGDNKDGWHER